MHDELNDTNVWFRWMADFYGRTGVDEGLITLLSTVSAVLLVLIASWVLYAVLSRIGHPAVRLFVARTPAKWDDDLFNDRLLHAVSALLVIILLNVTLPAALTAYPLIRSIASVVCRILIIGASVTVINRLLSSVYDVCENHTSLRVSSLKGLFLMVQIGFWGCGAILVIATLANRNPMIIISGLGASAAVLMLVFRDSILGVVAGVQLTFNDMLRPGDWISMPGHGINGIVTEVLLTTVKVQNYDMTTVTIPPYTLVSESFQNWRGMRESGGRRIMRSFNIDINTIRHLSAAELAPLLDEPWAAGISPDSPQVNVTLLRRYLEFYIGGYALERPDDNMFVMVRELQPTDKGLPVEIYLFARVTDWVSYEAVQATITDHILAAIPRFGLRVFQSPSGWDIASIRESRGS